MSWCLYLTPLSSHVQLSSSDDRHLKLAMMPAALSFWILLSLGCTLGDGRARMTLKTAPQTEADKRVSLVTSANQEFAFTLSRALAAQASDQGKNIFCSPASVSLALAALSVGAAGETQQHIFNALGFSKSHLTQAEVNEAFHTLLTERASENLSEGTAVFVDNQFQAKPEFLAELKRSYLSDGFNIDFKNATESANAINQYASDKTGGKIDEMVTDVDPNAVMYLISLIYYRGSWAKPFDPKLTQQDAFHVDNNTQVPVQMMKMESYFDVYYDEALSTSVLQLHFNSSYYMLLCLPDEIEVLENSLNLTRVLQWTRLKKSGKYKIYVPKFSIKTSYILNDVLTDMGLGDLFSRQADLSGIAEDSRLTVSNVVHKAALDIDEAGATAAAGTGVSITLYSLHEVPVLKFNRPFKIIIIESKTKTPIFVGKIVNPSVFK